jgi:hypothetical protein
MQAFEFFDFQADDAACLIGVVHSDRSEIRFGGTARGVAKQAAAAAYRSRANKRGKRERQALRGKGSRSRKDFLSFRRQVINDSKTKQPQSFHSEAG